MDAISALHDGEEPGVDRLLLRRHVASCATCRSFDRRLGEMNRALPVEQLVPVSTKTVRREIARADRASRSLFLRALLALVAVELVLYSVRPLLTGEDVSAASHPLRHLGAFTIAYAVAVMAAVLRPSRAGAILPMAAVLAFAIVANIVIDVVNGVATFSSERAHLPELLSVPLVWLLSRPPRPTGHEMMSMELRPGGTITWARLRGRIADRDASRADSERRLRAVDTESGDGGL